MTEDDTISRQTIGPSGREFSGHAIDRRTADGQVKQDGKRRVLEFVEELSEKDARRLANAEAWLHEYTDGKRNPNGVAFVEIGRLM
jgi:hypothetical protein